MLKQSETRRTDSMMTVLTAMLLLMTVAVSGQQTPRFTADMRGFSIREDTEVGTVVYTLTGEDPLNRPVSFSVSGDQLSVNSVTGAVTLVTPLDRERSDTVNTIITVTAESGDGDPVIVALRRQIQVQDVNDNPPRFVDGPYSFSVAESVSLGATLYSHITITDSDVGDNANITVTCDTVKSSEACSMFDVRTAVTGPGEAMAIISLKHGLDYETKQQYDLTLIARDGGPAGGLSSVSSVRVQVTDVQDTPPVFLNSPYSATVREGVKQSQSLLQGTRVLRIKVKDADLGLPRPIMLSLVGDTKGYFALADMSVDDAGVTNAALVTSQTLLDREDPLIMNNGGIYSFKIRADEVLPSGEVSGASSTVPVTIVVTDADDQQPVFSSEEVEVMLAEDTANGTPLSGLDLVVSDGDLSDHAKFDLSLEGLRPPGSAAIFTVFPRTVVGRSPVILKMADSSKVDFEDPNASQFVLRVIASQEGVPVSSAIINIQVTDANDNPPVFESPSYRSSVSENASPGTSITAITATDADSNLFGTLIYSLKGFGSERFTVDAGTGVIRLSPCGGLDHCLDYERQASYSLTYDATDGGGKVTSVNLFIDVLDENDNSPVFSQRVYRRTVDEGTTEFLPSLIVEATDADGPQQGGGAVSYSIQDGNTPDEVFIVGAQSGEISIRRPLTYLDTPTSSYTLTVRASDAGKPTRYTDVRVILKVGRQTNKSPRFLKKTYETSILETAPSGTIVETLEAMDPDGDPSVGDIAQYRLGVGAQDTFTIDPNNGAVILAKTARLDRDEVPQYKIEVLAVDRDAEAPQTATATLTVNIMDVNNKPPVFSQPSYMTHISERLATGDTVLQVHATDPDEGAQLLYSLQGAVTARDRTGVALTPLSSTYDFNGAFSVNSSTGVIAVSGPLDHNEAAVMVFSVRVQDVNASLPLQEDTAEVTIYIQAFSDKNPIFGPPWTPSHPYLEVSIKEEEPLDQPVFSVPAKDPVTGQPVRRYEKVSDPEDVFSVAPITGQVSLKRRLDYEASDTKMATLTIKAVAGERFSETVVKVQLEDINDNSPVFTEQEYHARISEDQKWPASVLQVSATDADTGEYGEVRYSLAGEAAMLFVINDTTGQIAVARGAQLDRERQSVLSVEVTATDTPGGGLTSRWSAVKVLVELTDVNDEAPRWSEAVYTAVVPENAKLGLPVTQIIATDPDEGLNGLVRYILPENQVPLDGLFTLDPETGILSVSSALRGKGRGEPYELTVRAMDQGTPHQQFSETIIKLYIGDVSANDGVPVFIRPAANEVATILENSKAGSAVFQVKAKDPDDPNTPNGRLVYSFLDNTANNGLFTISAHTGLISTQVPLDREQQAQYTVVVVAQDLGKPPQLTSRLLVINVTDADDNDPVFISNNRGAVELHLAEESPVGTVIGVVSATDRDEGVNALIDYSITYGNDEGLVELRRTPDSQAELLVRRRIDREQVSALTLTIACAKKGARLPERLVYRPNDPSLLQVTVLIDDLNDHRPEFVPPEPPTAGVRVDAPLQTEVLTLKAVDPDPTAPPIRYSLVNITLERPSSHAPLLPAGEVDGVFLLEPQSGILLTHSSLTRYTNGVFRLTVAAHSEPDEQPVYTNVKVVVVRDSDLMRFVFDDPPGEVRPKLELFKEEVENALPVAAPLAIYDTVYYTTSTGVVDFTKTGSCFQLEGRNRQDTNSLLSDEDNQQLKEVFKKFSVASVERCVEPMYSRAASVSADWVEVWVLVLAGLIGIGAGVAACTVCCLYARYKKNIKRQHYHLRLIDTPPQPGIPGPGSIIMLPTGPPHGGGLHHPPPPMMPPPSVPPSERGGRAYEWQERGVPMDSVSYGSSTAH